MIKTGTQFVKYTLTVMRSNSHIYSLTSKPKSHPMKYPAMFSLAALTVCALFSCSKSSNNYATGVDNTVGMGTSRMWTGPSSGYAYGDTLIDSTNTHLVWPKSFSRSFDTAQEVGRVNGFAITMFGNLLRYRGTDSTAHTVKFDTTYAGCSKTELVYYYQRDSMTFEFHRQFEKHNLTGIWFQTHELIHTHH